AHINLDSLISLMPESTEAKKAQEEYVKQLEGMITTMRTEFDTKYQDYMANQAKYSALIKASMEKDLQDLQGRIQEFQATAQQDLQKKNEELAKPIYEKAKKAIDQVAKENGYKYVLDSSTGIVLYSEASDDLLNLAKKKLGISDKPKAATPPAEAPKKDMPK
ncbi:MAG: OmpH family outer membrane protein, partial [Bdellovibrionales bacterium]